MWLFDLFFFLTSVNLICRVTDISKLLYFRESLGLISPLFHNILLAVVRFPCWNQGPDRDEEITRVDCISVILRHGRTLMKCAVKCVNVQWSNVQSWAEFHFQQDSNPWSYDPELGVLTTQPPGHFPSDTWACYEKKGMCRQWRLTMHTMIRVFSFISSNDIQWVCKKIEALIKLCGCISWYGLSWSCLCKKVLNT